MCKHGVICISGLKFDIPNLVYAKDTFMQELIMFSRFSACSAYSFALLSNTNEILIYSLILQE